MRHSIFLDTNVCSLLVREEYKSIRPRVTHFLEERFDICISAFTYSELLRGIIDGSEEYFEINRDRLRVMAGSSSKKFLPFGLTFAVERVLGITPTATALTPDEWAKSFRVAMLARSQKSLVNGTVRIPPFDKTDGFDPDLIRDPLLEGPHHDMRRLEQIRNLKRDLPSREAWASEVAGDLEIDLSISEASLLGGALDAAYEYERTLWKHARNGTYNFANHLGDWIDQQQLYYLCDPNLYFLTDDTKIRERCIASTQAARILNLGEILKAIGATRPSSNTSKRC